MDCYSGSSSNGEDRISLIPEPILVDILSLLPTIDAVRTSILARRWSHIWKLADNFEFDLNKIQHGFKHPQLPNTSFTRNTKRIWTREQELEKLKENQIVAFAEIVHALLQGMNIRKVFIVYTAHYYGTVEVWSHVIETWLRDAITRDAHEFDLCLDLGTVIELPQSFFTNEAIRVMKLSLNDGILKLPSIITFTRLKSMHLTSIKFYDENLTRQLFSSSPVLEILVLDKCRRKSRFKVLDISSISLKSLVIKIGKGYNLRKALCSCEFKVSAPGLESFSYKGLAPKDFSLGVVTFIKSVRIFCSSTLWKTDHDAKLWRKFIDGLRNVEVFNICGVCVKALSPRSNSSECICTPFHQLRYLKLSLEHFGESLQVILSLIDTSPGLETLIVNLEVPEDGGFACYNVTERRYHPGEEFVYMRSNEMKNRKYRRMLLKKFSTKRLQNLRKVEMLNIKEDLELEFLKVVFETQVMLETAAIRCSKKCQKPKQMIREELLGFPKASPHLAVVLL